jgi:hypothetical protein
MLDQEDPALRVEDKSADADGKPARKAPMSMQDPPDSRLEEAADWVDVHAKSYWKLFREVLI